MGLHSFLLAGLVTIGFSALAGETLAGGEKHSAHKHGMQPQWHRPPAAHHRGARLFLRATPGQVFVQRRSIATYDGTGILRLPETELPNPVVPEYAAEVTARLRLSVSERVATLTPLPLSPANSPAGGERSKSLTVACHDVSLLTAANGGLTSPDTLSDPEFAMQEHLCMARAAAIARGDARRSETGALTTAQILDTCGQLAASVADVVNILPLSSIEQVEATLSNHLKRSGASPATRIRTAELCLAMGYRLDDLSMSLAGALILFGQRRAGGDEFENGVAPAILISHHLHHGYGITRDHARSIDWADRAIGWAGQDNAQRAGWLSNDRMSVLQAAQRMQPGL